jgi:hypothetical protein
MKKELSLIPLTLTILLSGCKNNKHTSFLKGEWELRTEINEQTGTPTNYLPGNGTILRFTETDYEIYSHEKFVKSGKYTVERCKNYLNKKPAHRIVYDDRKDSVSLNSFFRIDSNKLSIYADSCNSPSIIYKKIKL